MNLRAILKIKEEFGVPVGLSDHTQGVAIVAAAVTLGACVIEKHFTLDSTLPGPDHASSLEPEEFKTLIQNIREVEAALGDGFKRPAPEELDTMRAARRSLAAASAIPADTVIADQHIALLRPGTGLAPSQRYELIGRRLRKDVSAGTLFTLEMVE